MQKNAPVSAGSWEQVLGWEDRLLCAAEHSPGKPLNHKPLESGRVSRSNIALCLSCALPHTAAIGCCGNWDPREPGTWL